MKKIGIAALVMGIVLMVLGGYLILVFLPKTTDVINGFIGIVVLLAGLMLTLFGVLLCKE